MRKAPVAIAAAVLALGIVEVSSAQQGPGWMGPGMRGNPGMMMGPGMMGSWVENQLTALRTELQLTDPQTAAFDEFAKAARDNTTSMMWGPDGCMSSGMMVGWQGNAPAMMQQHQQHMQARLEAMQSAQAAASKLYEQLQPPQRAVFDRYAMMGMMGMT